VFAALGCGGATVDFSSASDDGAPGDARAEPRAEPRVDAGVAERDASEPDREGGAVDAPIDVRRESGDASLDRTVDAARDVVVDVAVDVADGACADCGHLPNVRPGAPVECRAGQCVVPPTSCMDGFAHCSRRGSDGCETDIRQADNCGACGITCYGSNFVCLGSGRTYSCVMNCPASAPSGCGGRCVDTETSVENCAYCGHRCEDEIPNARSVKCERGVCKLDACASGWGDCNDNPGCETRLDTPDNCGACGAPACTAANATSTCVNGGCGAPYCNPGFANCDTASPDCEAAIGSPAGTCFPKYLGTVAVGGAPVSASGAALSADGSSFIVGSFSRVADFDPTAGLDVRTPLGDSDGFVTKLGLDGGYLWTRTFGGPAADQVRAVAVNGDGSVIVIGVYQDTVDFDPGPGNNVHTTLGDQEVFVLKLAGDGSLVWVDTFASAPGSMADAGALAVAPDGSIYVGGLFTNEIDFDPGIGKAERQSNEDAFVVKLTSDGAFAWVRTFGGPDCERAIVTGLALASDGTTWAMGEEIGTCAIDTTDDDVSTDLRTFVAAFAANGDYRRSWHLGVEGPGNAIAVGAGDSVYVGGSFSGSVDFDPGTGKAERSSGVTKEGELKVSGFVVNVGSDASFKWVQVFEDVPIMTISAFSDGVLTIGSNPSGMRIGKLDARGTSIYSLAAGGNLTTPWSAGVAGNRFIVAGDTDGFADFDPGPGADPIDRGHVTFASRYAF
jgi:hypothetical protein